MAHRDKYGRTTFGRKGTRQDDPGAAPAQLPIALPLKIRRATESLAVEDSLGRSVCDVYFEDDEALRSEMRRFTEAEARQIALLIARLLTDVESEQAATATIPLGDLNAENDE